MTDQELKDKVVSILNEQVRRDPSFAFVWSGDVASIRSLSRGIVRSMEVSAEFRTREKRETTRHASRPDGVVERPLWPNDWTDYAKDRWIGDSWQEVALYWDECHFCDGRGRVQCSDCQGDGWVCCSRCSGSGHVEI